MLSAKILKNILYLLDFFVGFAFGSVGHFFSILCFPVLAILKGIALPLSLNTDKGSEVIDKSGFAALKGGFLFFVGLILGVLNLIYFITPNYEPFKSMLTPVFETEGAIVGALIGSIILGLFYVLIYVLIALGASWIFQKMNKPG